ncbi:MAG: hypothetical protein H6741_01520 [Alphaproteobacteria bacterium]|nr:hypothetical protein [Alphaproteobacteria bacterium]
MPEVNEVLEQGPRALNAQELTDDECVLLRRVNCRLSQIIEQNQGARQAEDGVEGPWAHVSDDNGARVLLLDGKRGTGKTSLMWTLIQGWQSPRAGDKEGFLPELCGRVRTLPPLNFDPLPSGMPLYAWIVSRFRDLASWAAQKERDAAPSPRQPGPRQDLYKRWSDAYFAAMSGYSSGAIEESITHQAVTDWQIDQDRQIRDWGGLSQDWRRFLDELLAALERGGVLSEGGLIIQPIDDIDLQVEAGRALLLALGQLRHPRFVFLLTGDREHLTQMLALQLEGEMIRLRGGAPQVSQAEWARLDELLRGSRASFKLARELVEKALPSAMCFPVKPFTLQEAMSWRGGRLKSRLNQLSQARLGDVLEELSRRKQLHAPDLVPVRRLTHLYARLEEGQPEAQGVMLELSHALNEPALLEGRAGQLRVPVPDAELRLSFVAIESLNPNPMTTVYLARADALRLVGGSVHTVKDAPIASALLSACVELDAFTQGQDPLKAVPVEHEIVPHGGVLLENLDWRPEDLQSHVFVTWRQTGEAVRWPGVRPNSLVGLLRFSSHWESTLRLVSLADGPETAVDRLAYWWVAQQHHPVAFAGGLPSLTAVSPWEPSTWTDLLVTLAAAAEERRDAALMSYLLGDVALLAMPEAGLSEDAQAALLAALRYLWTRNGSPELDAVGKWRALRRQAWLSLMEGEDRLGHVPPLATHVERQKGIVALPTPTEVGEFVRKIDEAIPFSPWRLFVLMNEEGGAWWLETPLDGQRSLAALLRNNVRYQRVDIGRTDFSQLMQLTHPHSPPAREPLPWWTEEVGRWLARGERRANRFFDALRWRLIDDREWGRVGASVLLNSVWRSLCTAMDQAPGWAECMQFSDGGDRLDWTLVGTVDPTPLVPRAWLFGELCLEIATGWGERDADGAQVVQSEDDRVLLSWVALVRSVSADMGGTPFISGTPVLSMLVGEHQAPMPPLPSLVDHEWLRLTMRMAVQYAEAWRDAEYNLTGLQRWVLFVWLRVCVALAFGERRVGFIQGDYIGVLYPVENLSDLPILNMIKSFEGHGARRQALRAWLREALKFLDGALIQLQDGPGLAILQELQRMAETSFRPYDKPDTVLKGELNTREAARPIGGSPSSDGAEE